MAEREFQVVFHGELTGELPEEAVKRNLAGLFRLSAERAEKLFSGRPVVIKRGVDETTARKYEAAFRKAGAVCELRPAGEGARAEASAGETATGGGGGATAAGTGAAPARGASSATAAAGDPHGTVLHPTVPPDPGSLALDDSDTPIQPPGKGSPPAIDTSGLELATDDRPLSERPRAPAPEIDTSGLSLEPPPA